MINFDYFNVSDLLSKSTSDKNTYHKYGITYDLIFNSQYLKHGRKLNVLEIGVTQFGDGSAATFCQIPYVEKYVGIDNKVYKGNVFEKNVKLYTGPEYDAYNYSILKMIEENDGKFDIIIDDGPHTWESQKWFLNNYFELLNPGGVLICEDIQEFYLKHNLKLLAKQLNLYVLDLRVNENHDCNEIIALRFKE